MALYLVVKYRELTSSWQLFSECKVKKVFPALRMQPFFTHHYHFSSMHIPVSVNDLVQYARKNIPTKDRSGNLADGGAVEGLLPPCWDKVKHVEIEESKIVSSMLTYQEIDCMGKVYKNFSHVAT